MKKLKFYRDWNEWYGSSETDAVLIKDGVDVFNKTTWYLVDAQSDVNVYLNENKP